MFCSQLFGEALSFGLTSSLYLHEAFKKEDIYLQVMYHVQHDSLMQILNLNRNAFFAMSFSFSLLGRQREVHQGSPFFKIEM